MVSVSPVSDLRCLLGEGPVWDERAQALWFVDIKSPAVHRLDPASGEARSWPMPARVGALALREGGGLLVALKTGFAFFDPDTGAITPLLDPEPDLPGNRLNDGKCDARGRFWAGTMDDAERAPTGHLYRLDPDLALTRFEAGFTVTNGPAFSPDQSVLYFADSDGGVIYAHDFDLAAGRPGPRRIFARVPPDTGFPDGMCADAAGDLWSANWDGARLVRYRPDGAIAGGVEIPALRPTSCCFGGPDLDILYVTSARIGLDAAALARFPLSGAVFAVAGLGVRGLPTPRFAG